MEQTSTPTAEGRYASIDIGTVTSRILVADVLPDGSLEELHRGYAITNLGEGVDETHRLKPEAIERVAQAVQGFLEDARALEGAAATSEVRPLVVRAITTSAARDAENGADLVARLAELGVDLHIIPGEREAALSFAGVSAAFPGQRIAGVDTGGGSTEVILGNAGEEPELAHSFNIGCRRATERFLHDDPPARAQLDEARQWMRGLLEPWFAQMSSVPGGLPERMVAVAGTATSVVSVREAMAVYDSNKVHLSRVTAEELDEVFERLAAMPLAERREVVGLDPKRAPVIVGGLMVLQEVMRAGGFPEFTVSESDILQGLIVAPF